MNYHEVYTNAFGSGGYSRHSLNEERYVEGIEFIRDKSIFSVLDVSSGRGVFIKAIKDTYPDLLVVSTDLDRFHNEDVYFQKLDLSDLDEVEIFFGGTNVDCITCLDVMEHLEEHLAEPVIKAFAGACKYCLLTIAKTSDVIGGVELHLNQQGEEYWTEIISKYFTIEFCKRLHGDNLFVFGLST